MDAYRWQQFLDDWVAERAAGPTPLGAPSLKVYQAMWRAIGRALPDTVTTPDQLTAEQLDVLLDQHLHLKAQPRRRYLQLIGHVLRNPPAVTELLEGTPAPPRHLPVVLAQHQVDVVAQGIQRCTTRQQRLIALTLGAGLRMGEAAYVRWGHFRLSEAVPWLVVCRASGTPLRSAPIAPWALAYLDRPQGVGDDDFVFAGDHQLPVAASTLWRDCEAVLGPLLQDSRLRGVTRLRNTYGLRNLSGGAPIGEVKDWLGHHQEETTAKLLAVTPPKRGAI